MVPCVACFLVLIHLSFSCKAREAVKTRNQVRLTVSQKQQQAKEENLRLLAQKAREDRAGIRTTAAGEEGCDQTVAMLSAWLCLKEFSEFFASCLCLFVL